MDNNFSEQVKLIIASGRDEANLIGNSFYGTEHLLLGILKTDDNVAVRTLQALKVDVQSLSTKIVDYLKTLDTNHHDGNPLKLTGDAEKAIRVTVLEAKSADSKLVESEHVLLAILKNPKSNTSKILEGYGIGYDSIHFYLTGVHKNPTPTFLNWLSTFIRAFFEALVGSNGYNGH